MDACKRIESSAVDVAFVELTEAELEMHELRKKCRLYEIACAEQYEEFIRLQTIAIDLANRLAVYEKDALAKVPT